MLQKCDQYVDYTVHRRDTCTVHVSLVSTVETPTKVRSSIEWIIVHRVYSTIICCLFQYLQSESWPHQFGGYLCCSYNAIWIWLAISNLSPSLDFSWFFVCLSCWTTIKIDCPTVHCTRYHIRKCSLSPGRGCVGLTLKQLELPNQRVQVPPLEYSSPCNHVQYVRHCRPV